MSKPETTLTPYDEVPYVSYPYRQSHPDRLATVAMLMGMEPASLDNCRVLELGCSSGGNIIPIAEQYPGCEVIGIDLSQRQIAEGETIVTELGLKNIQLKHLDITQVGPELGKFDYIICHGVFSWVPQPVREKILDVCRESLAPRGVAYVSYNTYPGWHMRGMIRDVMYYRAQAFEKPADRVRHARALLDFLSESVPAEDNPYGMLLKREVNMLREKEDHYLLHEHLEEVNDPIYFHHFAERAAAHELQYLGEADFGVMSVQNFSPHVEAMLRNLATSRIETEQYMDFVRNRMFRQTLLCHQNVELEPAVTPDCLLKLHVSSAAKPEGELGDIQSKDLVTFRGRKAVTKTRDPLLKAAFLVLGEHWPQSIPFPELLASARSKLHGSAVVDTERLTMDSRQLAEPIVRCYATGQADLSVRPSQFTTEIDAKPLASGFARWQAKHQNVATNGLHETVQLDALRRHVLQSLDGQHDEGDLVKILIELVESKVLLLRTEGVAVSPEEDLAPIIEPLLRDTLRQLAGMGFLTCPTPPRAKKKPKKES